MSLNDKAITSRQNATFQRVRNAMRERTDEIVIEGPKMVADAIAAGWKPLLIATVAAGFSPPKDGLKPVPTLFTNALFDQLSDTRTSQGVLALFSRPAPGDVFARRDSIAVVLDGVQDPGNVGTIIRLAAAFDAGGVGLLPGCADPFSPKAIRASAGAVLQVPIAKIDVHDLDGHDLYAADGTGSALDPPSVNAVLLLGSEGAGVSPELRARAKRIAIPMSGRIESLNVGSAAAILLARSFALRAK